MAIDVLRWDAMPNVFAYHYPNCNLNTQSQLIVKESQEAVFQKEGLFYGPLLPGRHVLETKNIPFLTKFITSFTSGGRTPYSAEVWFVSKAVPLNVKWGTSDPILIEDPKYHIALPVRAFGQYGIAITDSCRFLARLVGRVPAFTEKVLASHFKGVIVTYAKETIAKEMIERNCSLLQIGTKLEVISKSLERRISEELAEYGVELRMFMVNSISTDENDPSVAQLRKALAKKAEMDIIGYTYAQERSFDTMQTAAGNEGAPGAVMGAGMGLGMGFGVGQPMGQAMGQMAGNLNVGGQQPPAAPQMPPAAPVNPAGAKFCANCGFALMAGAKFCPQCGTRVG